MFEAWSSSTFPEKLPSTGCCWWRQVKPCVRPASHLIPQSRACSCLGSSHAWDDPSPRGRQSSRVSLTQCILSIWCPFEILVQILPSLQNLSKSGLVISPSSSLQLNVQVYYSCCVILSAFHPLWTHLPAPLECEFSLTQSYVIYVLPNKWWGDQVCDPVCGGLW